MNSLVVEAAAAAEATCSLLVVLGGRMVVFIDRLADGVENAEAYPRVERRVILNASFILEKRTGWE